MASDPHPIPLLYRLCFNYFEPLMAIGGVLQILFHPSSYLSIALPNQKYFPSTQPLFTEIAGGWLLLSFHDLVTLRIYNRNVQIWKLVLGANLVSDLVYTFSLYQDLGLARLVNPALWEGGDWLSLPTTVMPMLLKVTFLLGWGLRKEGGKVAKRS